MRLALALCLLCPALWPRPGAAEHPAADRAGCLASGACYSLHHAGISWPAAREACALRGGALSTVRGGAELRAVVALLRAGPGPGGGARDLVFWVALERASSRCTLEGEPLRGFSWLSPDAGAPEGDTLPWVREPRRSCTARRCAGLQAAGGAEPAGWTEMRCHLRAHGYLCKYQFEAVCPAPRPGAASGLSFRAPFQLHSPALRFSPPGTEVSATCPGELPVAATCVEEGSGARWAGLPAGAALCPCPGRYLLEGRCAQLRQCLDGAGAFACECAAGFELGEDGRSCVTPSERPPAPGATAASPVPRRTWSPRAQEKPGERAPSATGQGSAATAQSTPSSPQTAPHAAPAASCPPSGATVPVLTPTPASAAPRAFHYSSTVVSVLVSVAVVVLVILTLTVLGLFKLCCHKSPSAQPGKGPLGPQGLESETEETARSSSAHCTDSGLTAREGGPQRRAEDPSLAGPAPASWVT